MAPNHQRLLCGAGIRSMGDGVPSLGCDPPAPGKRCDRVRPGFIAGKLAGQRAGREDQM